jgi:hypothetical protein
MRTARIATPARRSIGWSEQSEIGNVSSGTGCAAGGVRRPRWCRNETAPSGDVDLCRAPVSPTCRGTGGDPRRRVGTGTGPIRGSRLPGGDVACPVAPHPA